MDSIEIKFDYRGALIEAKIKFRGELFWDYLSH
jgi:hypothetical protein